MGALSGGQSELCSRSRLNSDNLTKLDRENIEKPINVCSGYFTYNGETFSSIT